MFHVDVVYLISLTRLCFIVFLSLYVHCVSKNDTDVAGYIFNAHQPILVVFGRDVGERVCY